MTVLTSEERFALGAMRFTVGGYADLVVTEEEIRDLPPRWSSFSLSGLERRVLEWALPFIWLSMPVHDLRASLYDNEGSR